MNSNYLYEYANLLERIFSVMNEYGYYPKMVEKKISYSPFFQAIERKDNSSIIDEDTLIKEIFDNQSINAMNVPEYNQCLWAAESFIRIQLATKLTFEAIFLYISIEQMINYFPIFHEMDFSHIIDEFNRLYHNQSVLSVLLNKYQYSLEDLASKTNIPYATLFSYKHRKRDIKNMPSKKAFDLSNYLRVRIETLLELQL